MTVFNPSYVGVRHDLLMYIRGKNLSILDVGCAKGENGKYLLENGFARKVYGIEINSEMAEYARKNNICVFNGDLNSKSFRNKIIPHLPPSFDYILFGDVLEHLYSPQEVLAELVQRLSTDGRIIISLPNIAHIELFIQIYLKGRWPSNSRGIFDRTHLRWFTKKDAYDLVLGAGLEVDLYVPKLRARDAINSKFDWKLKIIKFLKIEWVTFQHILICKIRKSE